MNLEADRLPLFQGIALYPWMLHMCESASHACHKVNMMLGVWGGGNEGMMMGRGDILDDQDLL